MGALKNVGTGELTTDEGNYDEIYFPIIGYSLKIMVVFEQCSTFSVRRILDAKNVSQASPMAPACGLYLGHVKYDLSGL